MEDILDLEPKHQHGNFFSILGFICAVATPLLFLFTYLSIPSKIKASDTLIPHVQASTKVFLITILLGIIFSLICILRKEQLKFFKPIGIVLNFCWLIIAIGFVYYISNF